MWENAFWLGVPDEEVKEKQIFQGDMNGRFAYYRCSFELEEAGDLKVALTAVSRYRLWVNGKPVLSGPCKGDFHRHFYEDVDLTEYLQKGRNVLAVQVLLCDAGAVMGQYEERSPLFGVASFPGRHCLAMEGAVVDKNGKVLADVTTGKADWKVYLEDSFYLTAGDDATANLGAVKEKVDFRKVPFDWKMIDFDESSWKMAETLTSTNQGSFEQKVGLYGKYRLTEREIPLLKEEKGFLTDSSETFEDGKIIIPAGAAKSIVFNPGVHTNAYPIYSFEKGKDAKITITYSERYEPAKATDRWGEDGFDRTEAEGSVLKGITDYVYLNGEPVVYETFWYRTFRFIQMDIEAAEEDVIVYVPEMRKTGYPLEVESEIHSDVPWINELWEICVRTLENCMVETYMDCPFYEQMQFSMDTRLQMLFNYYVSKDIRLAKKALSDFHHSMIPDGLIQGKYPSIFPQIISTFSLHYIFMLEEYYMQTGDTELLRRYRADVDDILEYYHRKIGESGLVENLGYWAFVDWQKEWNESMGTPSASLYGPSAIINLMYAYALKKGASIYEITGRPSVAEEYRQRRKEILTKIQETCWSEERGMFREGPAYEQYSQHAQSWAVLNEIIDKETAAGILRRSFEGADVIKCSFSTGYELCRALEWAGCQEYIREFMNGWIKLLEWKCTTCPEEPKNGRSECHAWSALPIYELMHTFAGIHLSEYGEKYVKVKPYFAEINALWGKLVVPEGMIEFSFDKAQNKYEVKLPECYEGEFEFEDGRKVILKQGVNYF